MDQAEAKFDYVIKELAFYEAQVRELVPENAEAGSKAIMEPALVDGVFVSDDLIDEILRKELVDGMAEFAASIPENAIDYHPGSDNKVIDWVHPSLYCLVYNHSRVIPPTESADIHNPDWLNSILGTGEPVGPRKPVGIKESWEQTENDGYKRRYQTAKHYAESMKTAWLPSEFAVAPLGAFTGDTPNALAAQTSNVFPASVEIKSYINNLHPVLFKSLYGTIAKIFARFVPMFEACLYHLGEKTFHEPRVVWGSGDMCKYVPKPPKPVKADKDEEVVVGEQGEGGGEEQEEVEEVEEEVAAADGEDWEDVEEEEEEKEEESDDDDDDLSEIKITVLPPVPEEVVLLENHLKGKGKQRESSAVNHSLRGRNLQVIVKLADIVLGRRQPNDKDPEANEARLRYDGGSWHVEGMLNERIVATGIYYYVSEGITRSDLAFRTGVDEPDYEQDDRSGVHAVYGMDDGDAMTLPLGSIETKQGRCVVFPNLCQHQVQPFKLLEEAEKGLRKILVFFLCDPTVQIVSTSSVPPQQKSWMLEPLIDAFSHYGEDGIPPELVEQIVDYMGWPMSEEEAKRHRAELMSERSTFVKVNGEQVFEREFSLCEH